MLHSPSYFSGFAVHFPSVLPCEESERGVPQPDQFLKSLGVDCEVLWP